MTGTRIRASSAFGATPHKKQHDIGTATTPATSSGGKLYHQLLCTDHELRRRQLDPDRLAAQGRLEDPRKGDAGREEALQIKYGGRLNPDQRENG
eukprot:scaffold23891_cov132-Cylindrotheca_fusiformis.AAC.7